VNKLTWKEFENHDVWSHHIRVACHTFINDEKDVALWPFRIFVINRNAANGVT